MDELDNTPRETDVDYDDQDFIMMMLGNASYYFFESADIEDLKNNESEGLTET